MRIATSTNLVSFNPDGTKTPMVRLLSLYAEGGWKNLDLNWCEMMNPSSPLRSPSWPGYVEEIRSLGSSLGLSFTQSHAPYEQEAGGTGYSPLILRAIAIDALLGVPLIVLHPIMTDSADRVGANLSYLAPFVEEAERKGVTVALENLESEREIRTADELCELVRRLASRNVGVCLDTGHAHMNGLDLGREIRTCGSLLIATHIQDNHGKADEHLLPFHGTIPWKEVMDALRCVGYRGYLTLECMKENAHLLPEEKPRAAVRARLLAERLLSL